MYAMWNGTVIWRIQIQSRPNLPASLLARRAHKSKADTNPIITNTKPYQIQRQESFLQQEDSDEVIGQLNGSDVLLALQKAATKNKKKNKCCGGNKKGKRQIGESDNDREASDAEIGVTLLMIKSDWGKRIEDLEKRLGELSEM